MQITVSQLQKQHSLLVDALKRGEVVELTYHGKVLGVIQPKTAGNDTETEASAMDAFFGMHANQGLDGIEDDLRNIRKGRRTRNDI